MGLGRSVDTVSLMNGVELGHSNICEKVETLLRLLHSEYTCLLCSTLPPVVFL